MNVKIIEGPHNLCYVKLYLYQTFFNDFDFLTQFVTFQAKHAEGGNTTWGINGETGELADMNEIGVWDCYSVKAQTYKTAIEVSKTLFSFSLSLVKLT